MQLYLGQTRSVDRMLRGRALHVRHDHRDLLRHHDHRDLLHHHDHRDLLRHHDHRDLLNHDLHGRHVHLL